MTTTPPGDGTPPPPPPAQPYPSYPVAPSYPAAPAYPVGAQQYGAPGPAPGFEYVSFWSRFGGYVIDGIITVIVTAAYAIPLVYIPLIQYYQAHPLQPGQRFSVPSDLSGRFAAVALIGSVWAVLYYGGLVARFGRTVGQRAIGATVVRAEDGGPLPAGRAFARSVIFWGPGILGLIPFVGSLASIVAFVGLLAVAWDRQKQGWHDKLGRSLVIKRAPTYAGYTPTPTFHGNVP